MKIPYSMPAFPFPTLFPSPHGFIRSWKQLLWYWQREGSPRWLLLQQQRWGCSQPHPQHRNRCLWQDLHLPPPRENDGVWNSMRHQLHEVSAWQCRGAGQAPWWLTVSHCCLPRLSVQIVGGHLLYQVTQMPRSGFPTASRVLSIYLQDCSSSGSWTNRNTGFRTPFHSASEMQIEVSSLCLIPCTTTWILHCTTRLESLVVVLQTWSEGETYNLHYLLSFLLEVNQSILLFWHANLSPALQTYPSPSQQMALIIMKARKYTHTFSVSLISNNIFCSDFIFLVSFCIKFGVWPIEMMLYLCFLANGFGFEFITFHSWLFVLAFRTHPACLLCNFQMGIL